MPLEQDKLGGFKFSLDQEINTGIYPGVFARRVPLWDTGENVQFTEFGVEKIKGSQILFDTTGPVRQSTTPTGEPIRGLVQNESEGDAYVYFGDLTQLYQYDLVNYTLDILGTGYTLNADSGSSDWDAGASVWDGGNTLWDGGVAKSGHWSMVTYGTFVLATNGQDFPQVWKNTGNFVDISGLDVPGGLGATATIEVFINRGPHVLGFNTNISGKEFIWCDADDVDVWVAAADNLAGQLEIRELKTDIVAAVPLGGRIAVYGEDQMFVVNYLANDLVFGYQPAINGIGAVSKAAVVPVGRNNYGLSTQGFYVTDGSSYEYIDEPAMRHWFQHNVNTGQMEKAMGYHDEENTQIRWYFPRTDSITNDYAVSYNYKRNTWSFIVGNRSAGDERRIAIAPITGDEEGNLRIEGYGLNNDQDPVVAWVRSKAFDMDDADKIKEVDSIRVGFVGTGLTYRIGWSELEDGPVMWEPYTPMEQGFNFHNLRTAGRWLYFEFRSEDLNTDWEVMSTVFIGRTEGTR